MFGNIKSGAENIKSLAGPPPGATFLNIFNIFNVTFNMFNVTFNVFNVSVNTLGV